MERERGRFILLLGEVAQVSIAQIGWEYKKLASLPTTAPVTPFLFKVYTLL